VVVKPIPAVFNSESQAASFIRARIANGTVVHADEAVSWDNLHERFEVKRINHQKAYSLDGACTNMAEEYFSRLRRAEIGIHHHIARSYLLRYAQESSWREDNRRVSNGDQVNRITALALKRGKSVDFSGYWHRSTFQVAEDFTSSASLSTRKAYHSSGFASAFEAWRTWPDLLLARPVAIDPGAELGSLSL
jgi:hypothetical protein